MLNLSDELERFINIAFTDSRRELVFEVFSILETFSVNDYEDKYMDILYREDTIDTIVRNQIFLELLEKDLSEIITQHAITLSEDYKATIDELVEVCNLLLLIPNLEDMSSVRYRVLSEDEPRMVLVALLDRYTSLPMLRAMEILEDVSEGLIDSMKEMCGEDCQENQIVIDRNHRKYIELFFDFINRTPCLGLKFHEEGYSTKLTTEELIKLVSFNMDEHIDKTLITSPAQAALDVLSILIITKEEYEIPLTKFKIHSELFTSDTVQVTRLSHMILGIMNDFGIHLQATKQQEALDGQNNNQG